MTIKAIMVDVDGVLIVHPDEGGWRAGLERDLGISAAQLRTKFFEPHWDDVIHGRAPLRERLSAVLREISPHVTSDELIDYWFSHDAHTNDALLKELASIRAEGVETHLATIQEHERARYLWDVLDFRSRFDGLHYAAGLGYAKPARRFYGRIEERTGFLPEDLFFIDDKLANVEGARMSGWAAEVWTGRETLRSLIAGRR
jgi:putative hydrolase of the HAD superfamily